MQQGLPWTAALGSQLIFTWRTWRRMAVQRLICRA
jgi:hypothetical protein